MPKGHLSILADIFFYKFHEIPSAFVCQFSGCAVILHGVAYFGELVFRQHCNKCFSLINLIITVLMYSCQATYVVVKTSSMHSKSVSNTVLITKI
jgi:hypothetical protein